MLINKITGAIELIAGYFVFAAMLLGFYEVVSRYAFRAPHDWCNDTVRQITIGSILIASCAVLWNERHVTISLLLSKLSGVKKKALRIFNATMTLATCAFFTFCALVYVLQVHFYGTVVENSLAFPEWAVRWPLILSFAFLTVVSIFIVIKLCREKS